MEWVGCRAAQGSDLPNPKSRGSLSQGRGAPGLTLIWGWVGGRWLEGEGKCGECGGTGGSGETVCLGEDLACHL